MSASDLDSPGLQLSRFHAHPQYMNVAATALLIYDYFITFADEIRWSANKSWNLTRISFTVSRYIPIAGALMTAYSAVVERGGNWCAILSDAINGIHVVGIIGAEGLLILRTYAFWSCSKAILVILLVYGLVCSRSSSCPPANARGKATLTVIVILSAAPIDIAIPGVTPPCVFQGAHSSALGYGLLALYEIVIMSLVVFKKHRDYREYNASILTVIYRDGISYMLCITGKIALSKGQILKSSLSTAISIGNVIVEGALPV
ncbi:hypothetical protein HYDPIDRAFT_188203, partial [Hydnomerulius pinastri MD-312]